MRTRKEKITVGGNMPRPGQTGRTTIVLTQPNRFNLDLQTYMSAIRNAENIDYTRRTRLYDLYFEILTDTHLRAVIDKRKNSILFAPVEFRRDGIPDDVINEQLRSPWFLRFISDAWDSIAWGNTLCQFFMYNGWINYELVPRKHVDPVRRLILHRQTDITGDGWDEFSNLLFIGDKDNLGLLASAAPYIIYKRNTLADWAQFSEIFGMPWQEYTYDGNDDKARRRTLDDASNQGGSAVIVHSEDSKFKLVESGNKSGSAEVYEKLTERCNSEISKLFLGNTLTTEASEKGTQALGSIHMEVEKLIGISDRKYILNILNYEMTDTFTALGFNTQGGAFEFVESEDIDPDKKMQIIEKLHNIGLPISHDYLYEQFGIEKPENYNELVETGRAPSNPIPEPEPNKEPEPAPSPVERAEGDANFINRLKGFFAHARRDRALEW